LSGVVPPSILVLRIAHIAEAIKLSNVELVYTMVLDPEFKIGTAHDAETRSVLDIDHLHTIVEHLSMVPPSFTHVVGAISDIVRTLRGITIGYPENPLIDLVQHVDEDSELDFYQCMSIMHSITEVVNTINKRMHNVEPFEQRIVACVKLQEVGAYSSEGSREQATAITTTLQLLADRIDLVCTPNTLPGKS
jgi:hypothetical protein